MIGCLDGTYSPFESLGYVFEFHLVEVSHGEYHFLFRWQFLHSGIESTGNLVTGEIGVGSEFFSEGTLLAGKREHRLQALALKKIDGLVDGYSIEPGVELAVLSEIRQVFPCLDEGVLQQIVSVIMVEYHSADLPVEVAGIPAHQEVEGVVLLPLLAECVQYFQMAFSAADTICSASRP